LLVNQAEDFGKCRIPPTILLAEIQDIGHGSRTPVSTRCGSCSTLEVLNRAQDEVRVRDRRTGPQELDALGLGKELPEPCSESRHLRGRKGKGGRP
jgi:hypothetical protein